MAHLGIGGYVTARAFGVKKWGSGVRAQNSVFLVAGILSLLAALGLNSAAAQLAAAWIGAVLVALPIYRNFTGARAQSAAQLRHLPMAEYMQNDPSPCLIVADGGTVLAQNPAATARFGGRVDAGIQQVFADVLAAPGANIYRLHARAAAAGSAVEDIAARGVTTRVCVQRLAAQPPLFLWRLEEVSAAANLGGGADLIGLPMLTANKSGVILFSNQALRAMLGKRPKMLFDVFGAASFRNAQDMVLMTEGGTVRAFVTEIASAGERREIYFFRLAQMDTKDDTFFINDVENMPVALMLFNPEGELRAANRAAREIIGRTPVAGSMFHEYFEGLGRPVSDWMADIASERLPASSQVLHIHDHPNAPDAFAQVSLRRVVVKGVMGVLAVVQDATALKTLEAQFVQSQKMEAIGQLAGGIAHDFNNLLTAISGHCDLLLMRHSSVDANYPDLIQISQNANRAADLVGQLLAFSRKQTLQPVYLEIQELVSDLTHLLNRLVGEKVHLSLRHGAEIGTIRADRRQLEQVMINLVVNARDAMHNSGTIRIETEAVTLDTDLARDQAVVPAGKYALIQVADTGTGIPAANLRKIFEPFYTTKKQGEGTGLGLSTAYGIIKQSGGFIFVDSTLGQGTVFTIYFPIHAQPAQTRIAAAKTSVIRQGEGVVLLVEDEAPVRAFAARALRLRGYTVLEAACAEDALELLENTNLQVDLFVSDVIMPGLDGPTWVREALKARPDTPVIFVSGYSEDVMSEQQARIPNATFLAKPFSLADLTATVQAHLHPPIQ